MPNQEKLENLKKELTKILSVTPLDTNLVLSLSNQIAELDENNVRFTVDAGLINRLGKELVAKEETAVSELIKNAYDADAVEVEVFFNDTNIEGGTLIIDDNGVGMTRQQLINGFMRISSTDKIDNPISPLYKRKRAGRKGIGRFATQRLGERLIIITQTSDSDNALKVIIEWNDFKEQLDLLLVQNSIEQVKKEKEKGTTLIIEKLREKWTPSKIKRIYGYINDLLQPFPLSKEKFTHKSEVDSSNQDDPGFKATFLQVTGEQIEIVIDEQTAFFQHAVLQVEGYVVDGQGMWSYKSEKLGVEEEINLIGKLPEKEDSKFIFLKNIHFRAYYFIYLKEYIPATQIKLIQSTLEDKGGIRVYRNKFRVLPYGEQGNDWVGIDKENRRRQIIAPFGNNSFLGFVEINDHDNLFQELSSREGFIENEAYIELQNFTLRILIATVLKTAELRGRKGKSSQKDWVVTRKKKKEEIQSNVDDTKKKLKRLKELSQPSTVENSNSENEAEELFNSLDENLDNITKNSEEQEEMQEEIRKNLLEEISMLRVLASLGLIIGEFTHEIRRFLTELYSDANNLQEYAEKFREIESLIKRIRNNVGGLNKYTAYFDRNISNNALREIERIELRTVVNPFIDTIQNDVNRSGFKILEANYNKTYNLYTVPMHKSEWASILFNFYSNAKKAIIRANTEGVLQIECGKSEEFVYLEFSDTGDGISEENEENIFNAFFTTSPASSLNSDDDLTGTGLGLKIVKDIVDSYGGNIFLKRPANANFTTTIRIEMPTK
jgi:signal transduction histidine kinase